MRVLTPQDAAVFLPALMIATLLLATSPAPVSIFLVVACLAGFAWILLARWRLARRIAYKTLQGVLMVDSDECRVPDKESVEREIERVLSCWADAGLTGLRAPLNGLLVYPKPFPGVHYRRPQVPFMGFSRVPRRAIAVGFAPDVSTTKFAHMLGHVLLEGIGHRDSEEGLVRFARKRGLPV